MTSREFKLNAMLILCEGLDVLRFGFKLESECGFTARCKK